MTFGEKLYALRKEKGLTAKELGQITGLSERVINSYEDGTRTPKDSGIIEALADGLQCGVEELTDTPAERNVSDRKDLTEEKAAPAEEKKPVDEKSAPKDQMPDTSEPFGKRLSALRKAKGLTLAQIAEKAKVNIDVYKNMEYKNGRPRDVKIYNRLAEVLGCEVDYLTEGDKRFEKTITKIEAPKKKVSVIPAKKSAPAVEPILTEEPVQDLGEIEENIPVAPIASVTENDVKSASSEAIKLVSRLSVLLSGNEISKSEKDAIMISLNGAYWR